MTDSAGAPLTDRDAPPKSAGGRAPADLQSRREALERKLAEERQARGALEATVARQQAQILDLSRATRSILTSRIWRTLSSAGERILSAQAMLSRPFKERVRSSPQRSAGRNASDSSGPLISVIMPVY